MFDFFRKKKKHVSSKTYVTREKSKYTITQDIRHINAATKIVGPDGELNSRDKKRPITTDDTPAKTANKTICFGLFDKFLAIAAGIIRSPVIKRTPIILIEIAITPANNIVKIRFAKLGFIPSADAISEFTVAANIDCQMKYRTPNISSPPIHIKYISFLETDNISPNSNPIKSKRIKDRKLMNTNQMARLA